MGGGVFGEVVKGGFVVGVGDFEVVVGVVDGKVVGEGVRVGYVEGGIGFYFDIEFW